MKIELIIVKNGEGREKNPFHEKQRFCYTAFEANVKTYPAPNIPDGEHRAYLQWQYLPNDSFYNEWKDVNVIINYESCVKLGIPTRQIWKLSEEQQPEEEIPIIKKFFKSFSSKERLAIFIELKALPVNFNEALTHAIESTIIAKIIADGNLQRLIGFLDGAEWQRKQPVSSWMISVGIKEPKVGDEILIYSTYINAYLVWEFKGQSDYEAFKYWMPLPKPPTT